MASKPLPKAKPQRTIYRESRWYKELDKPPAPKPAPKALPPKVKAALVAEVEACRAKGCSGQGFVAEQLGVSPTTVSQLLNDKYPGDIAAMGHRIQGAFMGATVHCPVYRTLAKNKCLEFQALPAAYTNPLRSMLAQQCPTCPHNRRNAPKADQRPEPRP